MTAMMDITPKVNLLRSFRGTRVSYPHLIGEGVDNAFDAGAARAGPSWHPPGPHF